MREALEERFRRHVEETGLLAGAPALLVAHSGGGDSTALLLLVSEWAAPRGVAVVSAHVAHGLRGAAGDEDARFCARMAASLWRPPPGASGTRLSSRSLVTSTAPRSSRATRETTRPRPSSFTSRGGLAAGGAVSGRGATTA